MPAADLFLPVLADRADECPLGLCRHPCHPDYSRIPPERARNFHQRLRDRVLEGRVVTREGFVFMPLQGRLTEHRSFQSMSPLDMIRATLDTQPLPVKATLHPSETYGAADHAALAALARHPGFSWCRRVPPI
ncbi:hypothetical protein ACFSHQ_07820 [Gemmobacter lanyuensis]